MPTMKTTWTVMTSAVALMMLAGCGVNAAAVTAPEPETRITNKKRVGPAGTPKAAPQLQWGLGPNYAGPPAVKAAKATTPAPLTVTGLVNANGVQLLAAPQAGVEAATVRDGAGQVVHADFSPVGGRLTWRIQAPETGLIVSKVKFEFQGEGAPVVVESTPAELEMSAQIQGETDLTVPFALYQVMDLITPAKARAEVRAVATLLDATGKPILGISGTPVRFGTTIAVK